MVSPLAPLIVWLPSQVTPPTHVPVAVSQRSPSVQSVSATQSFLHEVPLHTYGEQSLVTGVGQFPRPSQAAGSVATPAVQLAWMHVTDEPTKPAHDVRVLPSHSAAEHGLVADATGHAGRVPCGLPTTGVHVPALPSTSHASHSPVHALLQQTPSTQNPGSRTPRSEPHASPRGGLRPLADVPFVQNAPGAQSVVAAHEDGQLLDVPEQTYGEQVGAPA